MFEVCHRCLMPNTRPETPFKDGVCQACINFDTRQNVDWDARMLELEEVCDKHRSKDYYDCVIGVSGGKDSHAMVHYMKVVMGMNPLLVTVADPFSHTQAGLANFKNIGAAFDCDQLLFNTNGQTTKHLIKESFYRYLDPLRYIEQVLNAFPFVIAAKLGINLIMEGEATFIYGATGVEDKSAFDRTIREFTDFNQVFWKSELGIDKENLVSIQMPTAEELQGLEAYWLSYFVPWSSLSNQKIAKRYGFVDLTHEWQREGCIEHFEQIDSLGYMAHIWLKYPKFGFQRVSDIVSRRIRESAMSREEGAKLILERDHILDQLALQNFTEYLGISVREFWDVVEGFWNRNIFEKDGVSWKMKIPRFGGVVWNGLPLIGSIDFSKIVSLSSSDEEIGFSKPPPTCPNGRIWNT